MYRKNLSMAIENKRKESSLIFNLIFVYFNVVKSRKLRWAGYVIHLYIEEICMPKISLIGKFGKMLPRVRHLTAD
jgi:hypothetical protein